MSIKPCSSHQGTPRASCGKNQGSSIQLVSVWGWLGGFSENPKYDGPSKNAFGLAHAIISGFTV